MVNNAEKRFNISAKQELFHIDIIHNIIHLLVCKIGGSHILVSVFWHKLIINSFLMAAIKQAWKSK